MANELVLVKDGSDQFLTDWATLANTNIYKIGLYKNSSALTFSSVLSDITACDFGGYSGLLTLTAWDTGGIAFATPRYAVLHPVKTWTANGASTNSVYGYYVTNNAGSVLLWFQPRAASVTVGTVNGQTYSVIPKFTSRSEF